MSGVKLLDLTSMAPVIEMRNDLVESQKDICVVI